MSLSNTIIYFVYSHNTRLLYCAVTCLERQQTDAYGEITFSAYKIIIIRLLGFDDGLPGREMEELSGAFERLVVQAN